MIVVPTNDNDTTVLKYAEIAVIIPSIGIENAKFIADDNDPLKSIFPELKVKSLFEFPNPIRPIVPTNPPVIVDNVIGDPEA